MGYFDQFCWFCRVVFLVFGGPHLLELAKRYLTILEKVSPTIIFTYLAVLVDLIKALPKLEEG